MNIAEELAPFKGKWQQIAKKAGVSAQTVYRMAWGEEYDWRTSTLTKVRAALEAMKAAETH